MPAAGLLFLVLSGCCCCQNGGLMARLCNRWPDSTSPSDTPCGARVCPGCGRAAPCGGATTCEGYYNHPRFHPVPTQPVFGTPCQSLAGGPALTPLPDAAPGVPEGTRSPSAPASPQGRPELKPLAPPLPPATKKGDTPPQRLALAPPDGSSWIFSPSLPRSAVGLNEPKVEVKSEISAKDQQILR
jgi:hypothetical protein